MLEFRGYWNTPPGVICLTDAVEYLSRQVNKENDEDFKRRLHRLMKRDWSNETISKLYHGNNRATLISDLVRYQKTQFELDSAPLEKGDASQQLIGKLHDILELVHDGILDKQQGYEAIVKIVERFSYNKKA